MKKIENELLNIVAKIGECVAKSAIGSSSWPIYYQEQEPESVREKLQEK